jgi:rubrerythrin
MPNVDRECVTHHYACDCREARFKLMEAELAAERSDLELIVGEVSLAYDAITGGKLSKPNTAYGYIIEAVEERIDRAAKEAEEPLNDRIEQLTAALRAVEFCMPVILTEIGSDPVEIWRCPVCDLMEYVGHAPDCLIGLALAEEFQTANRLADIQEKMQTCTQAEVDVALNITGELDSAERDLADMERLAEKYGGPIDVECLLRIYVTNGTMHYQDEFSRKEIARDEALALLREKEGGA